MVNLHSCWYLWIDKAHSPYANMARDEAILLNLPDAAPVVRFYAWDRPCVSIGCFQSASAAPPGCDFVRRPTGGGVVDHCHDFTYTVVVPACHPITCLSREDSYAVVNKVVIQALKNLHVDASLTHQEIPGHVDRRQMVCFTNPTKYDVLLGDTKIAGAAQRRRKEGILHQGSIDLSSLPSVDRQDLQIELQRAFTALFGSAPRLFDFDSSARADADVLLQRIYSQESWNIEKKIDISRQS
jgi:lipoate-protein ligase A